MRELMRRTLVVLAVLASPRAVLCVLLLTGSTCAIVGVFLLYGQPAALLMSAVLCFAIAFLILRGLGSNV